METIQSKIVKTLTLAFKNNPLPLLSFSKKRERRDCLDLVNTVYENNFHEFRASLERVQYLNDRGHFKEDNEAYRDVLAVIEEGICEMASKS